MFVIIELETEENFKNECHPPCHFHRMIHLTAPKCHTMNIQAHIYVDSALKIWVAKKRSWASWWLASCASLSVWEVTRASFTFAQNSRYLSKSQRTLIFSVASRTATGFGLVTIEMNDSSMPFTWKVAAPAAWTHDMIKPRLCACSGAVSLGVPFNVTCLNEWHRARMEKSAGWQPDRSNSLRNVHVTRNEISIRFLQPERMSVCRAKQMRSSRVNLFHKETRTMFALSDL